MSSPTFSFFKPRNQNFIDQFGQSDSLDPLFSNIDFADPYGTMLQDPYIPQRRRTNPFGVDFATQSLNPQQPSPGLSSIGDTQQGVKPFDMAEFMKSFKPETKAGARLDELLANMPKRGNYGIMDRIAGSLAGASGGGIKGAQEAMDYPYNQQLSSWKAQVDPSLKAAELERQSNVNERQLLYNAGNLERYQRALEQKQLEDKETARKNLAREDTSRASVAVRKFAAEHKGAQILKSKGGNLTWIDPITHETGTVLDDNGQPVSSGTLTDEALQNLKNAGNLAVAQTGAMSREETAKMVQDAITGRQQSRVVGTPYVEKDANGVDQMVMYIQDGTKIILGPAAQRPGTPREPTPVTPAGEKVARQNKIAELRRNPDYAPYFKWNDSTKEYDLVDAPLPIWSGQQEKTRMNMIKQQIQSQLDAAPRQGQRVSPTTQNINPNPLNPQQRTIDTSQLPASLRQLNPELLQAAAQKLRENNKAVTEQNILLLINSMGK